jgi:hypothetical protein
MRKRRTCNPEPDMFGRIPSYGLFARHVVGLTVRDVDVTDDRPDARPAFRLQDVTRSDLNHVRVQRETGGLTFVLQGVHDFVLRNCPGLKDVQRDRVEREAF